MSGSDGAGAEFGALQRIYREMSALTPQQHARIFDYLESRLRSDAEKVALDAARDGAEQSGANNNPGETE